MRNAEALKRMAEQLEKERRQARLAAEDLEALNRKLSDRESYLTAVLDSAVDGIITINARGQIDRVNPAAEQLFGYSGGELIGRNVSCLMPAPHRQAHDGYLARYTKEGGPRIIGIGREVEGVRRDGSRLVLDLSVSEVELEGERFFVGLLRDKTEARRLEAQARRSNNIKAMITDASLDAMVTVDMQGYVQEYNAAAERMFGWQRAEIMGHLMEEFFIPPEMRQQHRHGMSRFKRDGSGPLIGGRVEVEAIRKNGERFPVELSLVAAEIDGERLATAFLRDISERKRSEQELIAARDAAEEASQAKSRFLSHMSHEIRSPLNAVLGAVNLVAERVTEQKHQRLLQTAKSSGQALLEVINEVLDFSKIEAGHLSICADETDLIQLVEDVLCSAQARMDKPDLDLFCSVDPKVSRVVTDPVRLRQIINVLVDNAVKFTDEGLVSVEVQHAEMAGDDAIQVAVCDSGVGIPAEHLASVFNEFEQVDATRDSRYGGTGLGLTIARRLIEIMGGSISVDSEPEQGSCFHFRLPVVLRQPASCAPELPKHLFLVSNNGRLREALGTKAQNLGVCYSGVTCLSEISTLLQSGGSIDNLLLIDERCLPAAGDRKTTALLESFQGTIGALCSDRAPAHAELDRLIRIPKPLTCHLLSQFVSADLSPPAPHETLSNRTSGSLLLVEDVAANRMVASEMLRSRGFDVITANDGLEALSQAADQRFDLILMDIRMPRMNGYEAASNLRRGGGLNSNTPIIALTANAEKSEIARCRELGMNDFVSKPFDIDRLLEVIGRHLRAESRQPANAPITEAWELDNDLPLLDEGTLEQLVRDTSPEVLAPMLEMFLDELRKRQAAMVSAASRNDTPQVREESHALKSCSGTFGARLLHCVAQELEDAARQDNRRDVTALTARLCDIADRTYACYTTYLKKARSNT